MKFHINMERACFEILILFEFYLHQVIVADVPCLVHVIVVDHWMDQVREALWVCPEILEWNFLEGQIDNIELFAL